eukprot:m.233699 g.233699  ORF g.233699 m.233699 type:complete len:293 (-) comp12553_c0_seq1:162-1040(-)
MSSKKFTDARNGAILQCAEAATLGMPLEVWKTRMGRHRNETTVQAFKNVYRRAGGGFAGVSAFWAGTSAKMVESASKGAVLMFSKELIKDSCLAVGLGVTAAGFIAGAGGGICQTTVMGPCTFLVTAMVNGDRSIGLNTRIAHTYRTQGLLGFYPGGVAIAWRQATNWASRQGFTDAARQLIAKHSHGDAKAALSVREEVMAGIMGGAISCWNHPFEVARIEAQSRAVAGEPKLGMLAILRHVVQQEGPAGLFKGVIPRIGLGIWQTLFMVTGANLIREYVFHERPKMSVGH